ncbi:MAG: type II toxin-antitoxin system RelE/ParE family toxin [Candidatus Aminicenantes bacterium]|nr:type II toxin-antitoxin system RelE/ParE family toxin [Candidatus Aminicenantes bacterium]
MIFSIRIKASAAKELHRIVKPDRRRIVAAIDRLAENPFLGNALKGDLRGLRRLRVGDHRVVYEVRESILVVLIVRVAHRRDVYRRRPGGVRR